MATYWPTGQTNTKQTETVDRVLVEVTVVVFRVSFVASMESPMTLEFAEHVIQMQSHRSVPMVSLGRSIEFPQKGTPTPMNLYQRAISEKKTEKIRLVDENKFTLFST